MILREKLLQDYSESIDTPKIEIYSKYSKLYHSTVKIPGPNYSHISRNSQKVYIAYRPYPN